MSDPKIVSVANQKGGVGKTTTAVNLAASLAHSGRKTLLIDLDPQGNATSGLGIDRHTSATIYDVLIGRKELPECIQNTELLTLCVIPANQNLIGAEVELINAISREKKLKAALKKLPTDFEFVVFDCPPSLGLLTINAFTASHSILIPTQCEYYALEGLGQLLSTFQIVKEDLNEGLEIEGVVLTMFDPRNKLTHEVVKEMKSHFPDKLYETVIPRNVKLSESPSFGKPVVLYDPESKGCAAYLELAKEFLRRNHLPIDGFEKSTNIHSGEPVVSDIKESQVEHIMSNSDSSVTEPSAGEVRAVVHVEVAEQVGQVVLEVGESDTVEEVSSAIQENITNGENPTAEPIGVEQAAELGSQANVGEA